MITEDMINAGVRVLEHSGAPDRLLVEDIFKAMQTAGRHETAPYPLAEIIAPKQWSL